MPMQTSYRSLCSQQITWARVGIRSQLGHFEVALSVKQVYRLRKLRTRVVNVAGLWRLPELAASPSDPPL